MFPQYPQHQPQPAPEEPAEDAPTTAERVTLYRLGRIVGSITVALEDGDIAVLEQIAAGHEDLHTVCRSFRLGMTISQARDIFL